MIPTTQIETKYTFGKEYMYENTLNEYKGIYYRTYNGKIYAKDGNLIPYEANEAVKTFDKLNTKFTKLKTTQTITKYTPKPNENDYIRGFILRYFCKDRILGNIYEINEETYKGLWNADIYDSPRYEVIPLKWFIRGTKDYIMLNNKNSLSKAELYIPGLIFILPNLLQFSKIS